MLRVYWNTEEGNSESKGLYIKLSWIEKVYNSSLASHRSKGFPEWG